MYTAEKIHSLSFHGSCIYGIPFLPPGNMPEIRRAIGTKGYRIYDVATKTDLKWSDDDEVAIFETEEHTAVYAMCAYTEYMLTLPGYKNSDCLIVPRRSFSAAPEYTRWGWQSAFTEARLRDHRNFNQLMAQIKTSQSPTPENASEATPSSLLLLL